MLARATLPVRGAVYLVSTVAVGLGVALMVRAKLGVAPNDVMNTGLGHAIGTNVGTASWITGAVAMALAWALGRRPRAPTIFGGVIVGLSINVIIDALPSVHALAARIPMLVAGLCVVWAAITGVVSADVGAGPLELVMLGLMDKRVGIRIARWGIELTLLAIGLALGGAAGLGTALFAFGTGPVLAVTLPWATERMGTGLEHPAAATVER
jgi:uncharacterized membrane protein YczE